MIAFIRGTVALRTRESIVLDVGGVGYEIAVPTRTRVGAIGDELVLHTHMQVRDDGVSLYGFESIDDRSLFQLLLSVSGIGPKGAISVLSHISPLEFRRAVATGDINRLVVIPGIGKKTAQRIVLELKDKLADVASDLAVDDAPVEEIGDARSEATEALVALGFSPNEARRSVSLAVKALGAKGAELSTDAILRTALSRAGRR